MPSAKQFISPLRYPGSKALLSNYIADFITEQNLYGATIVEPYAGSAIISFMMLWGHYAHRAILIERDPLIYSFWYSVFNHTDELIEKIMKVEVDIDTWHGFQPYRSVDDITSFPIIDLGLAGLFFNRTNYSGILKAGPLGGRKQLSAYGIDCRFNKNKLINTIEHISNLGNRVEVIFDDALTYLINNKQNHESDPFFLYIDPPYYLEGKNLYRYWYEYEDHRLLSRFLLSTNTPWLVSYDDHQTIRDLYSKEAELQQTYFDYVAGRPKRGSELLISNRKIPPLSAANNNYA